MGHYSDVYFGYNENVAYDVERLFRKKLRKEPADLFNEWFVGKYRDHDDRGWQSASHVFDVWMVCTTKSIKWYNSYEIPGTITAIVKYMEKNPAIFPQDDWFWVEVGEEFPEDIKDFIYYGNIGASPVQMTLEVNERSGDRHDIEHLDRDKLYNEPIPPYSVGTINYAYIERWVEWEGKEDRILPEDEIWN